MNINMGGGTHCINATSSNHGPSWRMIVHLTEEVEAYGIYPGGQNGNPGSKYYNNFIDSWAKGDYYKLLFIKKEGIEKNKNIKWKMSFVALK
jgi:penicillin amidase